MIDLLAVLFSFILMSIAVVVGVVGKVDEKGRWDALLEDIKKESKPMYDIIIGNKRKLSEFEERYIIENILGQKYGVPKEACMEFKQGFLDEHTDNPYFVRAKSPVRKLEILGTGGQIYETKQKELLNVHNTVVWARKAYADGLEKKLEEHEPLKDVVRDEKHGIDVFVDSSSLRKKKRDEKIENGPYSGIRQEEVGAIEKAIWDQEYDRNISYSVAKSHVKKVREAAGLAQYKGTRDADEPVKEELENGGYAKYLARQKMLSESRPVHYQKPTAGKEIVDSENLPFYRRIARGIKKRLSSKK